LASFKDCKVWEQAWPTIWACAKSDYYNKFAGDLLKISGWNPQTDEEKIIYAIHNGDYGTLSERRDQAKNLLLSLMLSPTSYIYAAKAFSKWKEDSAASDVGATLAKVPDPLGWSSLLELGRWKNPIVLAAVEKYKKDHPIRFWITVRWFLIR